jgi:hypothetical protein
MDLLERATKLHQSTTGSLGVVGLLLIVSGSLGLVTYSRLHKVPFQTKNKKSLLTSSVVLHSLTIAVGVLCLGYSGHKVTQHGLYKPTMGATDWAAKMLAFAGAILTTSGGIGIGMYQVFNKNKMIPTNRKKEQKDIFITQIVFTALGGITLGAGTYTLLFKDPKRYR